MLMQLSTNHIQTITPNSKLDLFFDIFPELQTQQVKHICWYTVLHLLWGKQNKIVYKLKKSSHLEFKK
jgi:hypothetical protein